MFLEHATFAKHPHDFDCIHLIASRTKAAQTVAGVPQFENSSDHLENGTCCTLTGFFYFNSYLFILLQHCKQVNKGSCFVLFLPASHGQRSDNFLKNEMKG